MALFHLRITVSGEHYDEVKLDMSEGDLERQVLEPYRLGQPITVNGKTIQPAALRRIRISTSERPSEQLRGEILAADRASPVGSIGGIPLSARVAARGQDVTDAYIQGPPGYAAEPKAISEDSQGEAVPRGPGDSKSVFLVHGRDHAAAGALRAFLRSLGLRIVEWEQALGATGDPNAYIGDVVEAGLALADGIAVLATPDDWAQLREELAQEGDGPEELTPRGQPRQNVIFEAGMAMAMAPSRTVIIAAGQVKLLSDISGRHLTRLDGSALARRRLIGRLRTAGLDVDDSGDDWLIIPLDLAPLEAARVPSMASDPTGSELSGGNPAPALVVRQQSLEVRGSEVLAEAELQVVRPMGQLMCFLKEFSFAGETLLLTTPTPAGSHVTIPLRFPLPSKPVLWRVEWYLKTATHNWHFLRQDLDLRPDGSPPLAPEVP